MKKLISILLVAMLIIGMFPATVLTAFAADAETFTYDFSTFSGSSTQYAAETHTLSSDVTLAIEGCHINTQLRVYGSKSTEYAIFKADNKPISAITVNAGYKADTLNVYGSNDNGATWAELASLTTTTAYNELPATFTEQYKWVKLEVKESGQVRIKTVTLTLNPAATEPDEPENPDVPACEHTNTEVIPAVAATCTEAGKTAGEQCADCGETITAQETIPATGHTYVDGTCENCGEEEPEGFTLVTDVSNLKAGDQIVIVAKDTNFAISTTQNKNNRGQAAVTKANNMVTFGDDVQVLTLEAGTTSGTFAFNTGSGYLYAASSSSNYLKTETTLSANSSWAITIAADGTATIVAQGTYTRNTMQHNSTSGLFACYSSASQKALTIYAMSAGGGGSTECEHVAGTPVKENEVAATCTKEGSYVNVTSCTECGAVISRETVTVPMIDHVYENDACTSCGKVNPDAENKAELMTAIPGNTDKVIIYYEASNVALGVAAKNDDLVGVSTTPADTQLPYNTSVAVLTVGVVDGKYTFANADGHYLSTTGNNALCFVENADANSRWTIIEVDGKFVIENATATHTDGTILALEYYGGAFTTYKTNTTAAYQMSFYLVEKGDDSCQHTTTEPIAAVEATCTETGLTEGAKCAACGVITVYQTEVPALGHNYVDGVCDREGCGDEKVIGNYVRVTNIADITDGQYVLVAVVDGAYYAMKNTHSSGKFETEAFDAANVSDTVIWTVAVVDGNITLQAENGYLNYGSSTNFKFADTAYQWTVAAGENDPTAFILNAATATRGIYYQIAGGKFGAYANSNADNEDYCAYLQLYKFSQPVVAADGTGYNSIDKALAAGKNDLKLYANATASTAFDGELYLDLNGFNATVNATKIYACDSSATVAKAGTGSLTTTSEVVIDNTVDGTRYIALKGEDGAYTFHVLELQLTTVSLRTSAAGIYYKAVMNCDEVLKAAIDCHGMVVSVENMPGADFATEEGNNGWTRIVGAPAEGNMTSCSVFGIFKAGAENAERGVMKIYANAYLKLTTGETIMADTTVGDKAKGEEGGNENFDGVAWSLKDVMVELNSKFSALDAADQENVIKFYEAWSSVMSAWELTNIATAATPVA